MHKNYPRKNFKKSKVTFIIVIILLLISKDKIIILINDSICNKNYRALLDFRYLIILTSE